MIPYPELAAALDRWRVKNGKPITAAAPPPAPSVASVLQRPSAPMPIAVAPAPAPIVIAPPAAPRTAPPPAPPAAVTVTTIDDEVDADMLEAADEYDNEGSDFAMSFSGPPPTVSGSIGGGDDSDESTHIGAAAAAPADDAFGAAPTTAVPPPSQWPEAREWPAEATAAASYGWGQPARASTDSDDETIVGGKKPS